MNTHADKMQENKSQAASIVVSQKKISSESISQFVDNRPESVTQRKLQEIANISPHAKHAVQLQAIAAKYTVGQHQPIQKADNKTGLPDNLKSGIENISGYSMDDVKVHYNSNKPAQLQAHAYTQGADIHVASGQEKHLPHEAWHVVQQKQGRVQPATSVGGTTINDSPALENEADVVATNALRLKNTSSCLPSKNTHNLNKELPVQRISFSRFQGFSRLTNWFYDSEEQEIIHDISRMKSFIQDMEEFKKPHFGETESIGRIIERFNEIDAMVIDSASYQIIKKQIQTLYYQLDDISIKIAKRMGRVDRIRKLTGSSPDHRSIFNAYRSILKADGFRYISSSSGGTDIINGSNNGACASIAIGLNRAIKSLHKSNVELASISIKNIYCPIDEDYIDPSAKGNIVNDRAYFFPEHYYLEGFDPTGGKENPTFIEMISTIDHKIFGSIKKFPNFYLIPLKGNQKYKTDSIDDEKLLQRELNRFR